jgi:hypothetical protein
MKKLFFIFILFCSAPLLAQEPTAAECKKFRTGTFYAVDMPEVVITRDEKFQTETNTITGKTTKMSITWTSDCTYELRVVKASDKKDKKMWKKIKVLTITITSTSEDAYSFSATAPVFAEPVKGTINVKK